MSFVKEFKEFALKGNAVDLAIGVVVGAAFGAITKSLVDDIINPPLGLIIGGINFDSLSLLLKPATDTAEAVTMNYGAFLETLINFLIIALVLFLVIKTMNKLRAKMEDESKVVEDTPAQDVQLLTEIRDILSKQN